MAKKLRKQAVAATPDDLLIEAHNQARGDNGLGPLTANSKLMAAASGHAKWMAERQCMSHTGPRWSSAGNRVRDEGYKFSLIGENIAAGDISIEAVMTMWMRSPGHKHNILGKFKEIGVGREGEYWCVVFGTQVS